MSWFSNPEGRPDPNFVDDGPKVADPAIPDRMVSTKRANQPFLAYVSPLAYVSAAFNVSFRLGTKPTATNKRKSTPPGASVKMPV